MEIYIESFVLQNILINLCLLRLVYLTTKSRTTFFKLSLASIIGTIPSVLISLFINNNLILNILKLTTPIIMILLGFKQTLKQFSFNAILLFIYTYAFGGIIISFSSSTYQTSFGFVTASKLSLEFICLLILIFTYIFELVVKHLKLKISTNNLIYIPKENFKSILIFSILFLCSILTVLNIIPYQIVLFLVLIITLIINKNLFTKADYTLLLTFVCFFIFTNNISNIESIKNFLVNLIHNKDFFVSLITSQIISNVPAALLLQPFSTNLTELLLGVNIGGLGTLIASLASLISFKIYSKEKELKLKQFFITFTLLNIIFLILLILFHLVQKIF